MEIDNPTRTNRLLSNAYIDINPFKGLHIRSILSYTHTSTDYYKWGTTIARYNNGVAIDLTNYGVDTRRTFDLSQSSSYEKSIETYATYNWSNDIHNVTAMIGNSVSKSNGTWVSAGAKDFPGESIRDISLTNDIDTKTGSGAFNTPTRFISYYGRVMYSLMNRYNLTATIRRDGSSNFGSGNRWGTFPSFATSWRISEEPFMKAIPQVSNLKLRLGWGRTGNAGNATNLATPQLSSSGVMYHFYGSGASSQSFTTSNGLAQLSVIDTNLKWETNEQWNVGLDIGLFNNDLNITLDYFVRNSKDLLLYESLRPSTGWNNVYTNYGEIRNKGFEFSVAYNHKINQNWTIGATLTGSTLSNKIIKSGVDIMNTCDRNDGVSMGDSSNMGTVSGTAMWWNNHSICREGYAVGSFYGYRTDGLFTDQSELDNLNATAKANGFTDGYQTANTKLGDVKYKDLNNDGHITEADMDVIGNGFPDLNYGLNINVTYKNWDASVYMYGVLGQDILSYSAMRLSTVMPSDDNVSNILKESFDNAWSADNPNGTIPRITILDLNHNTRCSDMWVKNGDFLKINNVQIGYTFPNKWLEPFKITGARAYVSVSNLCCISGYNKYGDPECGQGGVLWTGLDTGRYPSPRTYSFGLSVQF